jgi:hypothetical protein
MVLRKAEQMGNNVVARKFEGVEVASETGEKEISFCKI